MVKTVARVLCVLLAAPVWAAGQTTTDPPNLLDLSMEELMTLRIDTVYGASKFDQKVTRAPAAVTLLTGDEIRKFGHRTLADVLRSIRGLYVTYERNYSNFGVRGFARPGDFNTRILLLVDGRRMNDNLYSSALIGPEATLDVDLIERVEVIRGPSSSIYGSSAFFGVINVITRDAGKIDGLEGSAEGGSLDTRKARLTYGKPFSRDLSLVLSGSIADTDGQRELYYREFDTPQNNGGIVRNADGEHAHGLFGSLSYRDWTLSGAYAVREKHVPTASFGTAFNDGREKTVDQREYVDLKYARTFGDTQVMGRVHYDRYAYDADYPYNYAAPGDPLFIVVSHDDNYGDDAGAEAQLTRTFSDRHTLVLGGEYRRDLHLYQSNFTNDPRIYNFRDNRQGHSVGLYAQGEFALGTHLLLNAGLRYDEYSNFGSTMNPRMGLIYRPSHSAAFKFLYGQAYRAPNAYELYQASPGYSKASPALNPETIQTYELVYEQHLIRNLRLSVAGYHYDIADLISQTVDSADGLNVFQNVGLVAADGLELELEAKRDDGLLARASYALQKAQDRHTRQELNNSPRHLAKLNIALPVYKDNLYAGLELQYSSALATLAGNRTQGFLLANATVYGREVVKNLEVGVSVYNLFDRQYAYPGSTGHVQDVIAQDGRSFRLKATYRFGQ